MNKSPSPLVRIFTVLLACAIVGGGVIMINYGYTRYFKAVYPIQYADEVQAAADEFGIDPHLIFAIIHTESDFNPDALSSADAKGLMQLTDDTYQWAVERENTGAAADPQNLFDPAVNIRYGVSVLTLLGEQFHNVDTILAAYNAGQGRVREWLADPDYSKDGTTLHTIPYPETADYVRRVQQARRYYQRLYTIS